MNIFFKISDSSKDNSFRLTFNSNTTVVCTLKSLENLYNQLLEINVINDNEFIILDNNYYKTHVTMILKKNKQSSDENEFIVINELSFENMCNSIITIHYHTPIISSTISFSIENIQDFKTYMCDNIKERLDNNRMKLLLKNSKIGKIYDDSNIIRINC